MSATPSRFTGQKLSAVLEFQGRRQDWLAERAGISPALLTLTMKGERTIGQDVAERIAGALGIPFHLLFESPIGSEVLPTESDAA